MGRVSGECLLYDVHIDRWRAVQVVGSNAEEMMTRSAHAAVSCDDPNSVFICGGLTQNDGDWSIVPSTARLDLRAPSRLLTLRPMPTSIQSQGQTAVWSSLNEKVIVAGGRAADFHAMDRIASYDPRADQWQIESVRLPAPR